MFCPKCEGKTGVVDSRRSEETVLRKRRCVNCNYIFYTEEYEVEDNMGFRYYWAENIKYRRAMKKEKENAQQ